MLKTYFKTVNNKKLKGYKYRYIKGLYGLLKGLWLYYKNKSDSNIKAYVNYFIVLKITGEDPLKEETK